MPFSSLSNQFKALDLWLCQHQTLWQMIPFNLSDFPWRETYPDLCNWLDTLSLDTLYQLKDDPDALLKKLSFFIPTLKEGKKFEFLSHAYKTHNQINPYLSSGVPGRKWQQIVLFDQTLPLLPEGRWLEWCAGKGYLGRLISSNRQAKLVSLEWQAPLCKAGGDYARKNNLSIDFIQEDAFSAHAKRWVSACDHAVALHACGDLHVRLLKLCAKMKPLSLTLSPCCYHLIKAKDYHPLSIPAQKSSLKLSKLDLKLPLHETVTAGACVKNKRKKEMCYRLGFDALQRAEGISQNYLPIPTVQKSVFNNDFVFFCNWAAKVKNIVLNNKVDFAHFEQEGIKRFNLIEKIDLIQTLFKRPLEIWLSLDRAIYLEEQGYAVTLSTFCERALTPRNILIQAKKKEAFELN